MMVLVLMARAAQFVVAWQPGLRKWKENEKMKRKWRDNEEMEMKKTENEEMGEIYSPHFLIFFLFHPSVSISRSKIASFRRKMFNTALLLRMSQTTKHKC